MKRRITLWALLGAAVAGFWVLFSIATAPNPGMTHWTVIAITAPASLLGQSMPLTSYAFIFLNAAFYALFGLATETLRPRTTRRFSR
jgi:hypothetical protein